MLCRLTAGDSRRALELLAGTYAYLERVDRATGVEPDGEWMADAAHSVFAAHPTPPGGSTEVAPVRALDTTQRVVLSLGDVHGRSPEHIAALLGRDVAAVEDARRTGLALLASYTAGSTVDDVLRRGEVWFDDAMRAEVRAGLGVADVEGTSAARPDLPAQRPAGPTSRPSPSARSRRTMVGAGIAAAIVLVVVAIWVGSSSDGADERAALELPTTSVARPTTDPTTDPATGSTIALDRSTGAVIASGSMVTTPPTVPDERSTGLIADPSPLDLVPNGGWVDDGSGSPVRSWFQVWASPDAAHTNGRWLAVHTGDVRLVGAVLADGNKHRVVIGGHPALLETFADGVLHSTIEMGDAVVVELQSFGLTIDMLDTIAGSMATDGRLRPNFAPAADALLGGLDLRVSRRSNHLLLRDELTTGVRSTAYSSTDGRRHLDIEARDQQPDDLIAAELLTAPTTDPSYPSRTADVEGRRLLVGTFEDDGEAFVQWHDGTQTVTIHGNVDLSEIVAIVPTTRPATTDEWAHQTTYALIATGESAAAVGSLAMMGVGSTATDAGGSWSVGMSSSGVDGSGGLQVVVGNADGWQSYTTLSPDPQHPVAEFVGPGATVLVGWFTDPGAATAMRVTLAGLAPVDVPLVRLGDTGQYGATYAFSEPKDFITALVDANGDIVRRLAR